MDFKFKFPAVRGIQANKEYYISMIPIKYLVKIFQNDEEYILPEHRAQRRINETRIPVIKDYIINNRDNYVFSALSASIDGDFDFHSISNSNIGMLEIDMDARFLINDGQHRKAAIESAIKEDPTILEEDISVVFFKDEGLQRSQQMFTDLNKHAIKTSNSLSTLYDSRDAMAVMTKRVIEENSFLKKYTDCERDILGKNSSKLFTLNALYKANIKIIAKTKVQNKDYKFIKHFWDCIVNNISEWKELEAKELTKKSLREDYIITLAIILASFGKLGGYFYANPSLKMEKYLINLRYIDWSRSNKQWTGRVTRENGKVLASEEAISLTYLKIKELIGLELTSEEKRKNKSIAK